MGRNSSPGTDAKGKGISSDGETGERLSIPSVDNVEGAEKRSNPLEEY